MIQIKDEQSLIGKTIKTIKNLGGDLIVIFTDGTYCVYCCMTPSDNEIELCKSEYPI